MKLCPSEFQNYKCIKPVIINTFKEPIAVSCGKCLYCKQQKASEWTTRLELEYLNHEKSSFITLTYSEDNPIWKTRDLYYKDIQLFMKRLRKFLGNQHIKFFCAGEYGTKGTNRAHWHLIIFNLEITTEIQEIIKQKWGMGIVDCKTIEGIEGVAKYVSSYVLNKIEETNEQYQLQWGRKPPFHKGSQGLGLNQALKRFLESASESWKEFKDLSHIVYNGKRLKICRYLSQKITQALNINEEVKAITIQKLKDYMNDTIEIFKYFTNFKNLPKIKLLQQVTHEGYYRQQNANMLIISHAWHYRHNRKYEQMKAKFNLYKLDKEIKNAI